MIVKLGEKKTMLQQGFWLGIDIGSKADKVATLCAVEKGDGELRVLFEQTRAGAPYPELNTRESMLDPTRPSYLRAEVEDAVADLLRGSVLVERARRLVGEVPVTVAVDAPVAFALEGRQRATERASSPTFTTPTREIFERDLQEKTKEGFFRSVIYWKCVGFAVYRQLAVILGGSSEAPRLETLASWTAGAGDEIRGWRLREVFPSDVYKRGNGTDGVLADGPRQVLKSLLEAPWREAEEGAVRSKQTLKRLEKWRREIARQLGEDPKLDGFTKVGGTSGDLIDAFTAAYTACCEDFDARGRGEGRRGAAEMHAKGAPELEHEGAILTVRSRPESAP